MSEAKYYLQQLAFLDAEINALKEECGYFKSTLIKATDYTSEKVQADNTQPYDDKYSKFIEKNEQIEEKIDSLIDLKYRVSDEIDKLDDQLYRIILRERYVNNKSLEEISHILNYTERHIQRKHGEALLAFNSIMSSNVV
jgi:DNA-directed RNA polymerase specialized sigma subunit